MLVMGVGIFVLTGYGYIRANATAQWLPAEGTVQSLYLNETYRLFRGKGDRRSSDAEAVISYSYDVDGVVYYSDTYQIDFIGRRARLGGGRYYLEEILKVGEKYAEGTQVSVFHHPQEPQRAVLKRGYQGYLPTYLLVALGLIGAGWLGLRRQ